MLQQLQQIKEEEKTEDKLDHQNNTPLMLYCRAANLEGIEMIITRTDASLVDKNIEHRTALHIICNH